MTYFHAYTKADIEPFVRTRPGETKLGEVVAVPGERPLEVFLQNTTASFVVLGIAEDIGVLANYGNAGTATTWRSFLLSFLNIQANAFTNVSTIAVIGNFAFDEIKHRIEKMSIRPEAKVEEYRSVVTMIDQNIAELIQLIISHGKVPIVVGGGHNNCYPIIKGTATALAAVDEVYSKGIDCINLDAHIDYRIKEGRHSGNGFRYAKEEGFLQNYFALGIHENYISQGILNDLTETKEVGFITYEDIFVRRYRTWEQALVAARKFITRDAFTGIELDLDSIAYLPSSAATPCGVSAREALQYVDEMATHCRVAYLHVCEGIASHDGLVGKLISYIVSHFVKTSSRHAL